MATRASPTIGATACSTPTISASIAPFGAGVVDRPLVRRDGRSSLAISAAIRLSAQSLRSKPSGGEHVAMASINTASSLIEKRRSSSCCWGVTTHAPTPRGEEGPRPDMRCSSRGRRSGRCCRIASRASPRQGPMPTSIFELWIRHAGESRYPKSKAPNRLPWISAYAGMTEPHDRDAETDHRRRGQGARLRRRPLRAPPTPLPAQAMISASFLPRAGTATWPGSRRTAERRPPRARCGRRRAASSCSASITAAPAIRWRSSASRRAARSRSMRTRDYHDVLKGKLKPLAAALAGASGGEVKVFVDTAPVMEKPLAAARRPWLAGQAHQPGLARVRLLAVPRRDLHHRRAPARRARGRTIAAACRACLDICPTHAFPAPYRLDARALHLLPHHRAQGPHRRRASARRSATASMAATIASPSARGTSSRSRARGEARAHEPKPTPAARRAAAPRRRGLPRAASPARRSSASAATASCAMC